MDEIKRDYTLITKEVIDQYIKDILYTKRKPRQIWNGKIKRYVDYKQK